MADKQEDYALLSQWEQEFQEHYFVVLKSKLEHAMDHGSAGEAVEARADLKAFGDLLEAKKKFIRQRLEHHLMDGLESAVENFRQS